MSQKKKKFLRFSVEEKEVGSPPCQKFFFGGPCRPSVECEEAAIVIVGELCLTSGRRRSTNVNPQLEL